jgi:hypothetical protein
MDIMPDITSKSDPELSQLLDNFIAAATALKAHLGTKATRDSNSLGGMPNFPVIPSF